MVKLNKIYTKTGDDGTTGLATGARVRKDDARVQAYGDVDEANAAIGMAVFVCERPSPPASAHVAAIGALLKSIQHDMFDLGADLATPMTAGEGKKLRIIEPQVDRLEQEIDRFNEPLATLNSFVLPGGTELSALVHVARTTVRRAERSAVALLAAEPAATSAIAIKYLNRLSDLLFVLGRAANHDGKSDVLWIPGANRKA